MENGSGQVFTHRFSPQGSDGNWLGLHKAGEDFARYISVSGNGGACCKYHNVSIKSLHLD